MPTIGAASRRFALLVGAVLLLALGGRATAASDPIVGFWNFNGGVVRVQGSGPSFTGTIVKQTTFTACPHPVGELMWRIFASGANSTGVYFGFAGTDCSKRELRRAVWTVSEGKLSIGVSRTPGSGSEPQACGSPDTDCFELTRVQPVKPPAQTPIWSGTWSTNFGTMRLKQSGTSVTGTYSHDNGRIQGAVRDSVFAGTWTEAPARRPPRDAGDFIFTLAKNGKSFTSLWRYADGSAWRADWKGKRAR